MQILPELMAPIISPVQCFWSKGSAEKHLGSISLLESFAWTSLATWQLPVLGRESWAPHENESCGLSYQLLTSDPPPHCELQLFSTETLLLSTLLIPQMAHITQSTPQYVMGWRGSSPPAPIWYKNYMILSGSVFSIMLGWSGAKGRQLMVTYMAKHRSYFCLIYYDLFSW